MKVEQLQISLLLVVLSFIGTRAQLQDESAADRLQCNNFLDHTTKYTTVVCHNETATFTCKSNSESNVVAWLFCLPSVDLSFTRFFLRSDTLQWETVDNNGDLVSKTHRVPAYMESHFIIKYNESHRWNGSKIVCSPNFNESLPDNNMDLITYTYIIAGRPAAGSPHFEANVESTQNSNKIMLKLQWNTTYYNVDYSMMMIVVNGTNLQNVSYLPGFVLLDVSEYSFGERITIEVYGINECNLVSKQPTSKTIDLPDGTKTKPCFPPTILMAAIFSTAIVALILIVLVESCVRCPCPGRAKVDQNK